MPDLFKMKIYGISPFEISVHSTSKKKLKPNAFRGVSDEPSPPLSHSL